MKITVLFALVALFSSASAFAQFPTVGNSVTYTITDNSDPATASTSTVTRTLKSAVGGFVIANTTSSIDPSTGIAAVLPDSDLTSADDLLASTQAADSAANCTATATAANADTPTAKTTGVIESLTIGLGSYATTCHLVQTQSVNDDSGVAHTQVTDTWLGKVAFGLLKTQTAIDGTVLYSVELTKTNVSL